MQFFFIDAGMEGYGDHAAATAANNQQLGRSPEGEDVIANIVYVTIPLTRSDLLPYLFVVCIHGNILVSLLY